MTVFQSFVVVAAAVAVVVDAVAAAALTLIAFETLDAPELRGL